MNKKILFLQIREDAETVREEFDEFVRFGGLNPSQITTINVFETHLFDAEIAENFDAVFVGGSSDATVLEPEKYPFVDSCGRLLKFAHAHRIPTFASCFGFQVVCATMGGKIMLDKPSMEMGTYDIFLTAEAKNDTLYRDTPNPFVAVSGHKERAAAIPPHTTLLAYSKLCPYHSFKFNDAPFYAFQFHPEVDAADLVARITRYKERYLDSDGELEKIADSVRPTPEANKLIAKFVERVINA